MGREAFLRAAAHAQGSSPPHETSPRQAGSDASIAPSPEPEIFAGIEDEDLRSVCAACTATRALEAQQRHITKHHGPQRANESETANEEELCSHG